LFVTFSKIKTAVAQYLPIRVNKITVLLPKYPSESLKYPFESPKYLSESTQHPSELQILASESTKYPSESWILPSELDKVIKTLTQKAKLMTQKGGMPTRIAIWLTLLMILPTQTDGT